MKKHFNFCVVNNNNNKVYVSNSYIDFRPAFESCLVDVDINISNNRVITIEGFEKKYSLAFEKININDLNEPVESEYIKHHPGLRLSGIQFIKPYDYVNGWFAYKRKHSKTIVMNKFILEII